MSNSSLPLVTVNKLKSLAKEIRGLHESATAIAESARAKCSEAVAEAILCGQKLNEAKDLLSHGNWLPWLELNCKNISERTAQRYMKLAKSDTVSLLEDGSSLKQAYIAAGIMPDPADKKEAAPVAAPPIQDDPPRIKTADEIAQEQGTTEACPVPPPGWDCTRDAGHTGPCAAVPDKAGDAVISKGLTALAEQEHEAQRQANMFASADPGPILTGMRDTREPEPTQQQAAQSTGLELLLKLRPLTPIRLWRVVAYVLESLDVSPCPQIIERIEAALKSEAEAKA